MKKGWERKTLKEIAEYTIGLTYSPSDVSEEGMIVLRSSNVQNGKIDLSDLVRVKKAVKPKLIVKAGDILMCSRNGSTRLVGKTAVIPELDEEMTFGTFMTLVRSPFNPYLSYFFGSDEFRKQITRGENPSIKQVTQYMLDDVEINLPPLSEQQRIVSMLDEAFASIAQVKSNAEQNMVNARELFESVMEEIFGNGKDWGEKKLFEIGDTQTGTTPKTSEKKNYGDYIPFIKPADIDISGDGEIRYDNEGLSETGLQNGRLMSAGSVLMVCIGASIGKVGFADRDVSCNQQINAFTVNKPNYPKFFYYALRTQGFYNKVIKNSAQATLPIINKSKWENLTIRFPESLVEQRAIVGRLEALSAETGRLEEIYWQKVDALEELTKSVLAKAFDGEL